MKVVLFLTLWSVAVRVGLISGLSTRPGLVDLEKRHADSSGDHSYFVRYYDSQAEEGGGGSYSGSRNSEESSGDKDATTTTQVPQVAQKMSEGSSTGNKPPSEERSSESGESCSSEDSETCEDSDTENEKSNENSSNSDDSTSETSEVQKPSSKENGPSKKIKKQNYFEDDDTLNKFPLSNDYQELKQTRQAGESFLPFHPDWNDLVEVPQDKKFYLKDDEEDSNFRSPADSAQAHLPNIFSHDLEYDTLNEQIPYINGFNLNDNRITQNGFFNPLKGDINGKQNYENFLGRWYGRDFVDPEKNDLDLKINEAISQGIFPMGTEKIKDPYGVLGGTNKYPFYENRAAEINQKSVPLEWFDNLDAKETQHEVKSGKKINIDEQPFKSESTLVRSEQIVGNSIDKPPQKSQYWFEKLKTTSEDKKNAQAHLHLSGKLSKEEGIASVEVAHGLPSDVTSRESVSVERTEDFYESGVNPQRGNKNDKGLIKGSYKDGNGGGIKGVLQHGKSSIAGAIFHKPSDGRIGFKGSVRVGIGKLPGRKIHYIKKESMIKKPELLSNNYLGNIPHGEELGMLGSAQSEMDEISNDVEIINIPKYLTNKQKMILHQQGDEGEIVTKQENVTVENVSPYIPSLNKLKTKMYKEEKTVLKGTEPIVKKGPIPDYGLYKAGTKSGGHLYGGDVDFEDLLKDSTVKTQKSPRVGYKTKYFEGVQIESVTKPWDEDLLRIEDEVATPVGKTILVKDPPRTGEASVTGTLSKYGDAVSSLEINGNLPIGPDGQPLVGISGVMKTGAPNDIRGRIHL